ncbi:hypothetical protein [Streptomyces sp. NRRL F-5727]|uniref:hypothetical protein n=1 Tax=Streptomyces sp. NRRL F-5727 TaxID=1463871 RepID=UPI0004C8F22C|nr:hypothetical protein [Streptomyces sp. NRRL F-5727]
MTSERLLGPTHYLRGGERLLHGKDTASAVGAGRAEDWVGLDDDVFSGTLRRVAGWRRGTSTFLLGAHWFDAREVADWDTAPYWDEEAGAVSWGRPPTPSELALGLCHADPRVRAAALDAAGPEAPLPLLLLRCADGDAGVRERARAVFARALATADDATARALVALALRVGMRREGRWGRAAVLARTGSVPEVAVRELRASTDPDRWDARKAGIRAGAEAGILDEDALYDIALTARDASERLEGLRGALRTRRNPAARERFLGFLEACEGSEVRVLALRYAAEAGLPSADDLAGLALGHRDRHVRRLAARLLAERPDGATALGTLTHATDTVVRGTAVARLRADDLVPHLTDPSPWVRGLARHGLREAGRDPHAHLRTLCADPAAVTPAAVTGLAEQRHAGDAPLLRELTRHADGAVRARAVGGLRLLRALPDDALPPYADDPDPRVGAVVLRALRDDAEALRGLLGHRHARVRAHALVLLAHRHRLGWDETLPHLTDAAPEVARVARRALRRAAREVSAELLIALTAPGEAPARRALAMTLLRKRCTPEALLNALRLLDDPQPEVRAVARDQALQAVWDREVAEGAYGDEIRTLAEANVQRIADWWADHRRRVRAARAAREAAREKGERRPAGGV